MATIKSKDKVEYVSLEGGGEQSKKEKFVLNAREIQNAIKKVENQHLILDTPMTVAFPTLGWIKRMICCDGVSKMVENDP